MTSNFSDVAASTFTGNLSGNVTGNLTGTVDGGLLETCLPATADAAIAIPASSRTIAITKAGVCALTLADPTAGTHNGLRLTIIATTAHAHTVSNAAGSGFNGAGAAGDVATFGGAIGDNMVVEAYQGKWYAVSLRNVTLG